MRKFSVYALLVTLSFVLFAPAEGKSEVNVSITVPLPGIFIPGPPRLSVVPGSSVYYPPEIDLQLFFFQGYWYRPHGGGWYIARGYNGPWRAVGPRLVPRPLIDLHPGYRRMPLPVSMPYPVVQKNWRTWENERRWENERHGRHERVGSYRRGNDDHRPGRRGRGYRDGN